MKIGIKSALIKNRGAALTMVSPSPFCCPLPAAVGKVRSQSYRKDPCAKERSFGGLFGLSVISNYSSPSVPQPQE